jgi:hypothetical protein
MTDFLRNIVVTLISGTIYNQILSNTDWICRSSWLINFFLKVSYMTYLSACTISDTPIVLFTLTLSLLRFVMHSYSVSLTITCFLIIIIILKITPFSFHSHDECFFKLMYYLFSYVYQTPTEKKINSPFWLQYCPDTSE